MYSFINTSLKTCTCNYTEKLHTLICRGTGVGLHTASSPWPLCPSIHYRFVGGCFMDINIYRQLSLSLHLLCVSGCGCRRRCSFLLHHHYVAMDSLTHKSHMQTSWCNKQRELSMFSVCVKTTKQTVFSKSHPIKKKKKTCHEANLLHLL